MSRGRRSACPRSLLVARILFLSILFPGILLAFAVACDGNGQAPERLLDGSPVRAPAIDLEAVTDPAVLGEVRVVGVADVEPGSSSDACLRGRARDARPAAALVERVGVSGESVTLRDASGLYACDNASGPREEDRRWCGGAFGALHGGRLRDPRLDIGCLTSDGRLVGFVWVEPVRAVRYVVVAQPGYAETYEVAGGLPVRVSSTAAVDLERARAGFQVSEHDARGRLVRSYRLDAVVAG